MNQFSIFLLVGVANTALGYAVIFACMYFAEMSPERSNVAGYAAGLLVSYILNQRFTFRDVQRRGTEFVRFILAFLVAYTVNLVMLIVLINVLMVHAALSQVIAGGGYIVIFYWLNKYLVFNFK